MPTPAELNQAAAILDRVARNLKGSAAYLRTIEDSEFSMTSHAATVSVAAVDVQKAAELVRR